MNIQRKIREDYGGPKWLAASSLENYILEEYGWDLSSDLGGVPVKNPWGKGAGQLSLNANQVRGDLDAGLGFVVLKTVIAQDERGASAQKEWMLEAPRMLVERIVSQTGEEGWTVSWKGRGWSSSFKSYLDFVQQSFKLSEGTGTLIIPSVQVPLFKGVENPHEQEYIHTLTALGAILEKTKPALLELDLSPTLLKEGSFLRAHEVLRQLEATISAVRHFLPARIKLGLKLFNLADEGEQIALVRGGGAIWNQLNWLTIANRLFSSTKGISYGGYDLSDRNLRVLDAIRRHERESKTRILPTSVSATGNICSGKMMLEYAKRGCGTGQLHTFFQLPKSEYGYDLGGRSKSALHHLMFHPDDGLVVHLETIRQDAGYGGKVLCYGTFFREGGEKIEAEL